MGNSVTQEIRIPIKAILEGFDALKQVRREVKGIFDESGKGKVLPGAKEDAANIKQSIDNLNHSIKELPGGIAKANQESKGLISAFAGVIETGSHLATIVTGVINAFTFLEKHGAQIKNALTGAFNTVKTTASTAFSAIKTAVTDVGKSAVQGGESLLTSIGGALRGIAASAGEAAPALIGVGGGIVAIGAVAAVALAAVAALVAALAAVAAVVGSVVLAGTVGSAALLSLASSGFEYLDTLEKIKIGTGALIAQLSELKSNGIKLEGIDAVNAGIALAQEELAKLRVDAIQTTATFPELAEAFQAAVGSGLGAGLKLEEIRKITVGISQAGAALGVPYSQLRQEVNSILEGTIDINSRIAKNLGISNEQVKSWKQQGTLAEELNKRLAGFTAAGLKSAQTLSGIKSNLQEALNVFTGEATIKAFETLKTRLSGILNSVFDFKNGGIDKALRPIAELIDRYLVQGINRFADWLGVAIDYAKQLGGFIDNNRGVIDDILDLVDAITRNVVGLVAQFFGLSTSADNWRGILNAIRSILQFINGILVAYGSYVRLAAGFWQSTINAIQNGVIPAVQRLISLIPGVAQLAQLMAYIAKQGAAQPGTTSIADLRRADDTNTTSTAGLTIGRIPKVGGGGKGKGGGGGNNGASQLLDAEDNLRRTRIENAVNEYLAGLKKEQAGLEDSYKQRQKSTEDYYRERGIIALDETNKEIEKERQLLALDEAKLARAKKGADQVRAQAQVEERRSRIAVLETEQAQKIQENEAARRDAVEDLTRSYEELQNVLKEFRGNDVEANLARLNEKYRELLERATADGDATAIESINNIKRYETALIKLDGEEQKYQESLTIRNDLIDQLDENVKAGFLTEEEAAQARIKFEQDYRDSLLATLDVMIQLALEQENFTKVTELSAARRKIAASGSFTKPELFEQERRNFEAQKAALELKQRQVDAQITAGSLTPEAGAAKRLQLERDLLPALQKSIDKMRELAKETKTLDDDNAVKNLALDIENLGKETNELGKGIIDSLRSGLSGFFDDLISHTKSVKDAFKGMVVSILDQIARLAANELLKQIFASGVFQPGGALGFLSKLSFGGNGGSTPTGPVGAVSGAAGAVGEAAAGATKTGTEAAAGAAFAGAVTGAGAAFTGAVGASGGAFTGAVAGAGATIVGGITAAATAFTAAVSAAGAAFAASVAAGSAASSLGSIGAAAGKATGGFISGPGTATSDSIPIMASHGEYMIKAAAVRRIGIPLLNLLNSGSGNISAMFGRYAGGGEIIKSSGPAESAPGASPRFRLVNVLDKSVLDDHLQSAESEKIILNIIGKNPGVIQRLG